MMPGQIFFQVPRFGRSGEQDSARIDAFDLSDQQFREYALSRLEAWYQALPPGHNADVFSQRDVYEKLILQGRTRPTILPEIRSQILDALWSERILTLTIAVDRVSAGPITRGANG